VAREEKEAVDKVEAERIELEKRAKEAREAKERLDAQAELDAKAAREAAEKQYHDDWDEAILDDKEWEVVKQSELNLFERECHIALGSKAPLLDEKATESAVIAVIKDDAGVAEDMAKIIGEPCFQVVDVVSEPINDDVVMIPVKHLKNLLYIVEEFAGNCDLDAESSESIKFCQSLIY